MGFSIKLDTSRRYPALLIWLTPVRRRHRRTILLTGSSLTLLSVSASLSI